MKSNIMAMIPTSFALFLFFLPLVFVMKISHKDQVMKNLNDINAESLPLLMGLKSTINDLPENKLTSVISTFDELILHAQGQEQQLTSLLTHYEGLLLANETAYNASALTVLNAEEALDLATTRTTDATTDLATARAAHAEALRLRNLARTDYQNSVTNHANEDLNSTITVLQNVRAIIFGLLQDQSASPTLAPTASPEYYFQRMGRQHYGVDQVCTAVDEISPVRCCSDTNLGGWYQNTGCDNWQETDIWGSCKTLPFYEAMSFCAEQGGRLCTDQEVGGNCAYGTGCGYDAELVWTSTQCVPGVTFIGCFIDDNNRDLDHNIGEFAQVYTQSTCHLACTDYAYFALQNSGECFCGNSYGSSDVYQQVADEECGTDRLGRSWKNAIFSHE